MLLLTLERL